MKTYKSNGTFFLLPETDLVASQMEEIRDYFMKELRDNVDVDKVTLDATGIEIVDSLGVNLIIGLYRHVSTESKKFNVINAGEKFMKVANFFRFSTLFDIEKASSDD
ncbi:MAG: Anti-sigma-factor antagonist [Candidatus Magnetoglobus multicellularis str. Araruama]|uniref:Anti-sigma-factor antagonist n=1 Tax=Candidatus Magnetoglobus multicellularis str. Araruama TaxID=890399 RepID=A0A1V1PH02_9BACT|nr:MAG: Anti-sigma-factor antagonist [Candidatus Magnetoglobus multicellularis str. Araruama]